MKLVEITTDDTDHPEIRKTLSQVIGISKFTIRSNGLVDTNEKVTLSNYLVSEKIPVNFGKISNEFVIFQCNDLKSLKGCPEHVTKTVHITYCHKLVDLKHFPKRVDDRTIIADNNGLTSFKGLEDVTFNDMLSIRDCAEVTSLEGLPKSTKTLMIGNLPKVTSLKGLPEEINGVCLLRLTNITSLEGLPKRINGPLKIEGGDNITNLLQVFKVKGVAHFDFDTDDRSIKSSEITKIINKHLETGDMIECQEELIEAGFKRYARLK